MNSFDSASCTLATIEINSDWRWSMYNRLQELEIPCECRAYQPLRIHLYNAKAIVSFWCAFQQFQGSRENKLARLESCWQLPVHKRDRE